MNHEHATLAQHDLQLLHALVGGRWDFIAGETLTHHFITPVDVIVQLSTGGVRIVSSIFESDFEGSSNTYSRLSVSGDLGGLTNARRAGNIYLQHMDALITNILIVRDTVTAIESGVPAWTYTTDVGVVFALSDGAIVVAKASHHTEILEVVMVAGAAQPLISGNVAEWQDDLTLTHESSRRFIPLGERLTR